MRYLRGDNADMEFGVDRSDKLPGLFGVVDQWEYEGDEWGVELRSAHRIRDPDTGLPGIDEWGLPGITCSLRLWNHTTPALSESWTISASHTVARLEFTYATTISLEANHPLVWPRASAPVQLYFSGQSKWGAEAVIGDLYLSHRNLAGSWITFGDHFNNSLDLLTVLGGRYGLIGEGPKELIDAYEGVLVKHGYSTSRLVTPRNSRELQPDGSYRVAPAKYPDDLLALTVGDSYLVSSEFTASRVDGEHTAGAVG
jgi:hypothetical protein